ncbi:pentapeptide repeat-containing protein, partial [Kibdelosporangium lantanae]
MTRYVDEDLHGAEFRECDLTGARLIGVVMQDAVIDGLVTNLVVNGVEVTGYVEAELDRRHPVRVLIRSDDPDDLRSASRQLRADWAATIERIRRTPGVERRSVNDEWSAVQTMRHLVFVHDSWFRRCCLGSTDLFTPMGIGPTVEPYRGAHGLDLSVDPPLDEIVSLTVTEASGVTPRGAH